MRYCEDLLIIHRAVDEGVQGLPLVPGPECLGSRNFENAASKNWHTSCYSTSP